MPKHSGSSRNSVYNLKSDDTLASLHLLFIKLFMLLVCIFHTNVKVCFHAFGLCLLKNEEIILDCHNVIFLFYYY